MDNLVEVKLLFFAKAKDLSNLKESNLKVSKNISCSKLLELISNTYGLELIKNNIILALNEEYCNDLNAILNICEGDQIAIIPPLSELTHKKLDIGEITDLVAHESCGAVSIFVGTTRNNFEDKEVISLEYEAYNAMAEKAITKICDEIRTKWKDIVNIGIYHRLGLVPVKEASVIIAISSPHRHTSLDAVQFAIETLKRIVPIWKKEKYSHPEGSSEWKENKESIKRHRITSSNTNDTNKIIKSKLPKLNFDYCPVADNCPVSMNLIQITADENEVVRRVNCFIERNREEIDTNNVKDFLENTNDNEQQLFSCARVNSAMFKAKNSKFHLRVNRVKNEYGPQTINYTRQLDKLMDQTSVKIKMESNHQSPTKNYKTGIDERLQNVEKYFGIDALPISSNVYERLKKVEDRILYLESLSPEYSHFMDKTQNTVKNDKKTYSSLDLDMYINRLQNKSIEYL